jgi:hypothetical protein
MLPEGEPAQKQEWQIDYHHNTLGSRHPPNQQRETSHVTDLVV